jgi:hypothetical protein
MAQAMCQRELVPERVAGACRGGSECEKEVTVTTDRYTKLMLTIIAGALIWLCVRDVVSVRVQARADQQTVSLSGIDERHPLEVKIVSIGRTRWTVKSGPFDTVEHALPWEPIEAISVGR